MIITLHVIFLSPSCFFFHRQCDKLLETFGSIVNSFDHETDICIGHREKKKPSLFLIVRELKTLVLKLKNENIRKEFRIKWVG